MFSHTLERLVKALRPPSTDGAAGQGDPGGLGDVFSRGTFPVCPETHDQGVRWLFDLSTVLLLLDCRPGDRVLDLGAGPGFSAEWLARLGYSVAAVDPDLAALRNARRRPQFDRGRIAGTVQVAAGLAECLPLGSQTCDGVLGMNVLHHVADLERATSELARVLKPGARAVFCEPGLDHLGAPETRRAIREHGENDNAFDVMAFLKIARRSGFREAMLSATLQSPLRLLPFEEVPLYLTGAHPRPHLTPSGVVDELHRRHSYTMLVRDGFKAKTSRAPGVMVRRLTVSSVPRLASAGSTLRVVVKAENTGDTTWLSQPGRMGGFVTVGFKLHAEDGRVVADSLGRTFIPHDVSPGSTCEVVASVPLPRDGVWGNCSLQVDLVDELVCWFADLPGNAVVSYPLVIR